jgi:hypothetical protein
MLFNERKMQALEIFTHHCELRPREWAIKAGFYPLRASLIGLLDTIFRTLLCFALIGLNAPALGQGDQPVRSSAGKQQIRAIINELPAYSPVRRNLEEGWQGDGIEQQYMALMHGVGVKRCLIEVRGFWRDGKPSTLKVAWHLYFSKYDGPGDAITAPERLKPDSRRRSR